MDARLKRMGKSILLFCPFSVAAGQSPESSPLGGIEAANLELARALARRGHKVTLATKDTKLSEDIFGHVSLNAIGSIDGLSAIISSNETRPFDLMPKEVTRVWWIHNPFAIEKLIRKGHALPLLRHSVHAVFLSAAAERAFTKIAPLKSRNVISYGVQEIFRQGRSAKERRPVFVWASQPQRGLQETVSAWLQARPEAEMHIFGARPDQIGVSEKDLTPHRVLFQPRLGKAELARRYAEALAMIYPGARDETFCLAAAEAQSMGLPVITLGIGSLSERVQNGINGIVCRTYAEMMAQAKRLIADPDWWSQLSEGAVGTSHLYTWKRASNQWDWFLYGSGEPTR